MTTARKKILSNIARRMSQQQTSPSIISAVLEGISDIWAESPTKRSARSLPGITQAIESQHKIGWWSLICGRWSKFWEIAQANYFTAIKSPRSSKRWQATLIRLFWETAWDVWDFRNKIEHSGDNRNRNEITEQLNSDITIQWKLGAPAQFERQYFQHTLTQLHALEDFEKKAWLRRVKSARSAFATRGAD